MPVDILLQVNPLIKGQIELPFEKVEKLGKLFFGRMWTSWELSSIEDEIRDRNITVVLNLLEESHGEIAGANEIWAPIDDFSIPSDIQEFMSRVDETVDELKRGKNILVHCYGGKGRTSLAIAMILIKLGLPNDEALNRVFGVIRGPETEEQKDFVRTVQAQRQP